MCQKRRTQRRRTSGCALGLREGNCGTRCAALTPVVLLGGGLHHAPPHIEPAYGAMQGCLWLSADTGEANNSRALRVATKCCSGAHHSRYANGLQRWQASLEHLRKTSAAVVSVGLLCSQP